MAEWIILFGDDDVSYGDYRIGPFSSEQAADEAAKELYDFAEEKDSKEEFSYLANALEDSELEISRLETVAEVIARDAENEDPADIMARLDTPPPPPDDRPAAAKALDMHVYNHVKSPEFGRDWIGTIETLESERVLVRYSPTWNSWTDPRGRVESQRIWFPYGAFGPSERTPPPHGINSFSVHLTDALSVE